MDGQTKDRGTGDSRFHQYQFIRKGEFPRNMDGQTKTDGQVIPGFISICSSVKVNFQEIWTDRQRQRDRVIPVYNSSQKLGLQGENDGVFFLS